MSSNPGTRLIIVTAVFSALSTGTTAIRLYTKIAQRQFQSEDWNILAAVVLLLIQVVFIGLQYQEGSGQHVTELGPERSQKVIKYVYATEFLIFPALAFTKASICCFVLRIKDTKLLRWSLYAMMAFLFLASLMCEIVLFAQCRPLHAFWDRAAGTCWDFNIYNDIIWVQVASSVVSDGICTLLPIIILWKVRIPLKVKIAVCGLMALGILATVCGAVRASLSDLDKSPDLTYTLAFISVWAVLEAHIGVIGANMALARLVYFHFFPRPKTITGSAWSGRGYEHYGSEHTGKTPESQLEVIESQITGGDGYPLSNMDTSHGILRTTEVRVDQEPV